MLSCYLIFHLNLMYSSIEEEKRREVIQKCYWPLLHIAEKIVPIGIELTGITLEIINTLDKGWIKRLKELINQNRVELIGSGYSQVIGPLLPKNLNLINQKLGLKIYKKILGVEPNTALVNEMAYSAGLVDVYAHVGYKAIVMEWNNPYRFHKEWNENWRFKPQIAIGVNKELTVIWADSIAFQKFQRVVHSEMSLKEYLAYIRSQNNDETRFFPLYANDAEIFNFRPNRYETESKIKSDEFKKIQKILQLMLKSEEINFILPSKLLEYTPENRLILQSVEQPIPVKKQEKYNINRWAITGRDDFFINTKIFNIYKSFQQKEPTEEEFKKILYLASSDFRTHITPKRWKKFKEDLNAFSDKWKNKIVSKPPKGSCNFEIKENRYELIIETKKLKIKFNKQKGVTAKEIIFKHKSKYPLIGTIPHGFYKDISFGADFYSLHSIIERPGMPKITNLSNVNFTIKTYSNKVAVLDKQNIYGVTFTKYCEIFNDTILIRIKINCSRRYLAVIHPFNMTFIPSSFERNSLFFATHNGGDLEKFYLKNSPVHHSQSLSHLISAKHGLGATEGILIVGDKDKYVSIRHDQSIGAVIPAIFYQPIDDTFFLRVRYSAQEIDDTFVENNEPMEINCLFEIY